MRASQPGLKMDTFFCEIGMGVTEPPASRPLLKLFDASHHTSNNPCEIVKFGLLENMRFNPENIGDSDFVCVFMFFTFKRVCSARAR